MVVRCRALIEAKQFASHDPPKVNVVNFNVPATQH